MSRYHELIVEGTNKFCNRIKKSCAPIENHFGVKQFWYYKITNSGDFVSVTSFPQFNEYFYEAKLYHSTPYINLPSRLKSGVWLRQSSNHPDWHNYLNLAQKKFNNNFGLQIINKLTVGVECWGFGLNSVDCSHHMLLINELPLLKLFIEKFRLENRDILDYIESNAVNIAALLGPGFEQQRISMMPKSFARQEFLTHLGLVSPLKRLTSREISILDLILLGLTAKEIAEQLDLSFRTIEHYIEKMKDKLDCRSKSELIQKAHELKLSGLFDEFKTQPMKRSQ